MSSTQTHAGDQRPHVFVTFLADPEMRKRIKLEAVIRGVTLNEIIMAAVDKHLPTNSK